MALVEARGLPGYTRTFHRRPALPFSDYLELPLAELSRDDVDALYAHFAAIGAHDEHYECLDYEETPTHVRVGWDNRGGAALTAYGVHLVAMLLWQRGTRRLQECDLRFGVVRGLLGSAVEAGFELHAVRADDPSRLALAACTPEERVLHARLSGPEGRCWCSFCCELLTLTSEADALAASAPSWTPDDVRRLSTVLAPTEALFEALFVGAPTLSNAARDGHLAVLAGRGPVCARAVGERHAANPAAAIRACAAGVRIVAHEALGEPLPAAWIEAVLDDAVPVTYAALGEMSLGQVASVKPAVVARVCTARDPELLNLLLLNLLQCGAPLSDADRATLLAARPSWSTVKDRAGWTARLVEVLGAA